MPFEFKLPDVGEGLHEGEIVKWYVKEGERVIADQHLVDVLTDKATVEITCPKAAVVLKLSAKPGQKVRIGDVIVVFDVEREAYQDEIVSPSARNDKLIAQHPAPGISNEVLATPAVRKLAKDLGIDLSKVRGTGIRGRITEENVRSASASPISHPPSPPPIHGPEDREPLAGIRRRTAEKMIQSQRAAAFVTHFEEADVTELIKLRESMKPEAQSKGVKLTYLAFIFKAAAQALKEFPYLNASIDDERQEIVLKKYIGIGIAMDTEKGLFTPVIKDGHQKDLWNVAREIEELSQKAKAGKLALQDFQGGTFTITNIGPIGGTWATPIINHPEAAILGVMKIAKKPVVRGDRIGVGAVLNLCLTFDHRIADGAYAARFMNRLIELLGNRLDWRNLFSLPGVEGSAGVIKAP